MDENSIERSWANAREICSELSGLKWPESLNIEQIAKLRHPNHPAMKREVESTLADCAKTGALIFADVKYIPTRYCTDRYSARLRNGDFDGAFRELREEGHRQRQNLCQPAQGWKEWVIENDGKAIAEWPAPWIASCEIVKRFPNGLPIHAKVAFVKNGYEHLTDEFSLGFEVMLTAAEYAAWCRSQSLSIGDDDSPLHGWLAAADKTPPVVTDKQAPFCSGLDLPVCSFAMKYGMESIRINIVEDLITILKEAEKIGANLASNVQPGVRARLEKKCGLRGDRFDTAWSAGQDAKLIKKTDKDDSQQDATPKVPPNSP